MKTLKTLLLPALGFPALGLFAAVDLPTLAHDAADNVFSGKNYSWTSSATRPDGTQASIQGQAAQGNLSVSIQDGTTTRTLFVVNEVPYVLTDSGWQKAGPLHRPPGDKPPADAPPLPPPPPPHDAAPGFAGPGGHRGPGGRGGFGPGARSPDRQLTELISRVSSWTADGDVLTGEFSGKLPAPGSDRAGARDDNRPSPTESGVVKLWIQSGVLTKVQITSTVMFTSPSGETVTHQRNETTTFSAVGTTAVSIPAELQALVSKANS